MPRSLKAPRSQGSLRQNTGGRTGLNRDLAAARQQLAQVEHEKDRESDARLASEKAATANATQTRRRTQTGGGIGGEGDGGPA